jgi:hypothetical protein
MNRRISGLIQLTLKISQRAQCICTENIVVEYTLTKNEFCQNYFSLSHYRRICQANTEPRFIGLWVIQVSKISKAIPVTGREGP